jgi:hypothetical protein
LLTSQPRVMPVPPASHREYIDNRHENQRCHDRNKIQCGILQGIQKPNKTLDMGKWTTPCKTYRDALFCGKTRLTKFDIQFHTNARRATLSRVLNSASVRRSVSPRSPQGRQNERLKPNHTHEVSVRENSLQNPCMLLRRKKIPL